MVLLIPVVLLVLVVLLVPVVLLVLRVFLLLGALPLLLGLGVHLLGVVPLPVARELLPITHPLPMTVVTVTTAITLVHLYAVACMVALGALAGLVVVVLRGVLGELLDVTGLFLSNENTIGPAVDLLALVLREASRDRR